MLHAPRGALAALTCLAAACAPLEDSASVDIAVASSEAELGSLSRTIVFIQGTTQSGQDMFIRGGLDHDKFAASHPGQTCTTDAATSQCAIPIVHRNLRNGTTSPWKQADNFLDWYGRESGQTRESIGHGFAEGSAADWTTNNASNPNTVANQGFGFEPLNKWGDHYWMLDVDMDCSRGILDANGDRWFEVKTFISNGPGWEGDVAQTGTPYASRNHFAKCGQISTFRRGSSDAIFTPLGDVPPPTCAAANLRCAPVKKTFTFPFSVAGEKVQLSGDWLAPNDWSAPVDTLTPVLRSGGTAIDHWEVTRWVQPGRTYFYGFRYFQTPSSGMQWRTDPNAPRSGANNMWTVPDCAQKVCSEVPAPDASTFDWHDAVIYHPMVDRFRDSDGKRCRFGQTFPGTNTTVFADEPTSYKGGDWVGLASKLDYIKGLGVNVIWVTYAGDNLDLLADNFPSTPRLRFEPYHGYHPADLNKAESCFAASSNQADLTSNAALAAQQFKDFIAAAHTRGIKVIMDYTAVHVSAKQSPPPPATAITFASPTFAEHKFNWFWHHDLTGNDFDFVTTNHQWCTCGDPICPWTDPIKMQQCWFAGPDLAHWNYNNDAARSFSIDNIVNTWVKGFDLDGLRLDAMKHIPDQWALDLRARLNREVPGKRFYMVGETFSFPDEDRTVIHKYIDPQTKLDGQFDFPLRQHLVESLMTKARIDNSDPKMQSLARFMDLNDDYYGPDAIMSPFLGNQDTARIIHLAQMNPPWGHRNDQAYDAKSEPPPAPVTDAAAYERLANGFAVLMTNRGAPLIYMGDEVGREGAGDPDDRKMIVWNDSTGTMAENSFQTGLRQRVVKLTQVRAANPALRRGRRSTVFLSDEVWVYKMVSVEQTVYVAINRADSTQNASNLPSGALEELLVGAGKPAGATTIQLPPRQTRIYK